MSLDNLFVQYRWTLVVLAVWEFVWKGLALWKSAKNNQKYWFVAILMINSVGLLPIIYLLCCHYGWLNCCSSERKKRKKK